MVRPLAIILTKLSNRCKYFVCALLTVMLLCSSSIPLQDTDDEYNIKAAFIYKFTNYIDWDSLIPSNQFVIGVVGPSPVSAQLDEIARSKTIKNRKIVVRQFNRLSEISPCQILFISRETSISLAAILSKTAGWATLIISEQEGYAQKGTGINFIEVNDKLKFEANPKKISTAGLKASSQLLKLAIIVD